MILLCDEAMGKYIPKLVCETLKDSIKPAAVKAKVRKYLTLQAELDSNTLTEEQQVDAIEEQHFIWDDIVREGYVVSSINETYGLHKDTSRYLFLPKALKWDMLEDGDIWLVPRTDYVLPMWIADCQFLAWHIDSPDDNLFNLWDTVPNWPETELRLDYTANGANNSFKFHVKDGWLVSYDETLGSDFRVCKLAKDKKYGLRLPKRVSSLHNWQFINLVVRKWSERFNRKESK